MEEPSPAELAVLRGLAAGLSRREIGAQLYISLNTVKSHARELYRKLGATSRTEVVARAEALGLLEASQSPGWSWAHSAQMAADVRHARSCMSPARYRLVVKGELGARYASAFEEMTIFAHDGITEITGAIIDQAHL